MQMFQRVFLEHARTRINKKFRDFNSLVQSTKVDSKFQCFDNQI